MDEEVLTKINASSQTLKDYVTKLFNGEKQEQNSPFDSGEMVNEDDLNHLLWQRNEAFESLNNIDFFDQLGDNWHYDETLDSAISNLKMNSVSSRRKDELFKRYRKQQEQKIGQRRKELEQKYAYQADNIKSKGEFILKGSTKNQIFTLKNQDFEKLRPDTDLNDTILDNYLKLMHLKMLPGEVENKTFIFSSFFMGKLCADIVREEMPTEKQTERIMEKLSRKVEENYATVKRWTRRIDIFEKEFLVIPINAYKHWNCMIVVGLNNFLHEPSMCRIIYLDSYFEKRNIFTQAIKTYLRLQLGEKKGIKSSFDEIPAYQLLVPRQTNTHDCGLYTLSFIEYLLLNHQLLEANMEKVENRDLLQLFPRSIVFTMRECLRRLFSGLLLEADKDKVIMEYRQTRKEVFESAIEVDYDEINEREFQKYYRINGQSVQEKSKTQAEAEYLCKVKFYLDAQINHYQKDK